MTPTCTPENDRSKILPEHFARHLSVVVILFVLSAHFLPTTAGKQVKSAEMRQSPAGFKKIGHVIWIIQENRSFDNYFGRFPGADGFPPLTCLPKMPGSRAYVSPFHMPSGAPFSDLDHSWRIATQLTTTAKWMGSFGRRDSLTPWVITMTEIFPIIGSTRAGSRFAICFSLP